MSRKQTDGVEKMLRRADRTLDEWFKQSRMTSQQASVVFARFLDRARREGAGALRQPVDSLKSGLGKLSASLKEIEKKTPGTTSRRRATTARKRSVTRKPKKAA